MHAPSTRASEGSARPRCAASCPDPGNTCMYSKKTRTSVGNRERRSAARTRLHSASRCRERRGGTAPPRGQAGQRVKAGVGRSVHAALPPPGRTHPVKGNEGDPGKNHTERSWERGHEAGRQLGHLLLHLEVSSADMADIENLQKYPPPHLRAKGAPNVRNKTTPGRCLGGGVWLRGPAVRERAAHTAPPPVPPDLGGPALPGVPANGHGEAVSMKMSLSSGLLCA